MSSRYDERNYDRESRNYGGRSESDYGRSWDGRAQGNRYGDRDRDTEQYNRQRYGSYGRSGWESERDSVEDRDERYGGSMDTYGRGYGESYNTYGRSSNEPYGSYGR